MEKPVSANLTLSTPVRIQRKRTKGWRMPPNAVSVARPSPWGNRFVVGKDGTAVECARKYADELLPYSHRGPKNGMDDFLLSEANLQAIIAELKGKNLACWCRLCPEHEKHGKPFDVDCPVCWPCHADVLLEIANAN